MSRVAFIFLALALASCAPNATSFAPSGSQPAMPTILSTKAKPNDGLIAHVEFKYSNISPYDIDFIIYTSYNREPWFVYARECLTSGDKITTDVYYREPNKTPQIKFSAEVASPVPWDCAFFRGGLRTIAFHSIYFKDKRTTFHVNYDVDSQRGRKDLYTLCAEGGGWNRICDDKGP